MKPLQFITLTIFALSISACSIFKKPVTEAQQNSVITDRKWKLVELEGKPVGDKINDKEPFLLLHTTDNRYSASGGCNGIGGNFSLEPNGRIRFSAGMSTKMACENMEIENGLTKALMAADNYSIDGDNLSLNKARMAPLARFKALENTKTIR
jgi:heat shock protein HslJ